MLGFTTCISFPENAPFEPHTSWIFQLNFKLIKKKSVFKIELSHSYNKTNFDDAKEAVRSRNVKKERQYNGQRKIPRGPTMIYKTLHRKLKIEQHELYKDSGVNTCATFALIPIK